MTEEQKQQVAKQVAANLAGLRPSAQNHPDNYAANRAAYERLDLAAWRKACREYIERMEAEGI